MGVRCFSNLSFFAIPALTGRFTRPFVSHSKDKVRPFFLPPTNL